MTKKKAIKYDHNGERESKTVNGVKTEYFRLNGRLIAQKTGEEYIYFFYDANGSPYGIRIASGTESNDYYYIFNAQGDIIGLLDSTGTQVVRYEYGNWGEPARISGTLSGTVGQKNPSDTEDTISTTRPSSIASIAVITIPLSGDLLMRMLWLIRVQH